MAERASPAGVDDDLDWFATSSTRPCPVCGGRDGCGVAAFRGGVAVDCRRTVSAWPMTEGGWLHRRPADGAADDPSHGVDGASCAFPVPPGWGARPRPGADDADAHAPGAAATETVLGAFATRLMAERALVDLLAAGFGAEDISVLGGHGERHDPTTARGAVTGAGVGAALGGFGAFAIGLVAAAIPGIGPVVALGPFSIALSAALGGGFVGGLIGFFAAHGVPEHDAARYAERVQAGEYIVAVHTSDARRAESILALSGAEGPIRHTFDARDRASP